jgi:8-oxo-dGTP pyrophosphatase MutT (NUDIX family)
MNKDWYSFQDWLAGRLSEASLPGYEAQRLMTPPGRPHQDPMPPGARKSAVLLLLYPEGEDIELVLIQRTEDGGVHSGQIAFPGGKMEVFDRSPEEAALREASEEINLNSEVVTLLGRLSPLYIPVSDFAVYPIIGICDQRPDLLPYDNEVASILYFSFHEVFPNKKTVRVAPSGAPNMVIQTPAYILNNGKKIWGATAMILSELEFLWERFKKPKTAEQNEKSNG